MADTIPLEDLPAALRGRVDPHGLTVHVVLEEDLYESRLGDGVFLYPRAAFPDELDAQGAVDVLTRSSPRNPLGRAWHQRVVRLLLVDGGTALRLESRPPEEHFTAGDILALLRVR